jgi:hypothetical protein
VIAMNSGGETLLALKRVVRGSACFAFLAASGPALSGEVARGGVYSVVEIGFRGPHQTARDAPARDISLKVRFRHESGSPEYAVYGYWDGDGRGGLEGDVYMVRFCPTKAGRWDLVDVDSNAKKLIGQHRGDHVTAITSKRSGFWEVDPESAGGRWYKRSDGSHPYIIGNTQYSFLSGRREAGPVEGHDIAGDVAANARFFKKLRFGLTGDRYPHPSEKPFLDDSGKPTDSGDFSHRPNPRWFRKRVDVAVRAAHEHDVIADLILCGPDTEESRSSLRAAKNGGDAAPFLRFIAARYGSFPNVWLCLCNEYDIKSPSYSPAEIVKFGETLRGFLAYPVPLSVHASERPDGEQKPLPAWSSRLDREPAWNDHQILQRKLRALGPSADIIRLTHDNPGQRPREKPTINDELSYQGDGDNHSEADTLEAHLGAFLGGGYGTTGWKTGNKLGHYFWGGFNSKEHTSAAGLRFLRESIDRHVAFWRMAPDSSIFPDLDAAFRAMAWPGREYVLGTTRAGRVTVALPEGKWTVRRFDVVARKEAVLERDVSGRRFYETPESRAVLYHFKKTEN